jgi:pyrroloquinoline quinone (PQQ) biosynthesis protein C
VSTTNWLRDLDATIDNLVSNEAPILSRIVQGKLGPHEVQAVARRHYAEVRTFIDIKLPSRLRLCPHDESRAKSYFSSLYIEEQGNFVPGANHAHIMADFCISIGIESSALEREFEGYWPNYRSILLEPPSIGAMVRELAVSYTWESMIHRVAEPLRILVDRASSDYGLTEHQKRYFPGHLDADEDHQDLARDTLAFYSNNQTNRELIEASVRRTLLAENPWTLPLNA